MCCFILFVFKFDSIFEIYAPKKLEVQIFETIAEKLTEISLG